MVSHNLRLELFCSLRFAPPPPPFYFFLSFFTCVMVSVALVDGDTRPSSPKEQGGKKRKRKRFRQT